MSDRAYRIIFKLQFVLGFLIALSLSIWFAAYQFWIVQAQLNTETDILKLGVIQHEDQQLFEVIDIVLSEADSISKTVTLRFANQQDFDDSSPPKIKFVNLRNDNQLYLAFNDSPETDISQWFSGPEALINLASEDVNELDIIITVDENQTTGSYVSGIIFESQASEGNDSEVLGSYILILNIKTVSETSSFDEETLEILDQTVINPQGDIQIQLKNTQKWYVTPSVKLNIDINNVSHEYNLQSTNKLGLLAGANKIFQLSSEDKKTLQDLLQDDARWSNLSVEVICNHDSNAICLKADDFSAHYVASPSVSEEEAEDSENPEDQEIAAETSEEVLDQQQPPTPASASTEVNNVNQSPVPIILIIASGLVVLFGFYYFFKRYRKTQESIPPLFNDNQSPPVPEGFYEQSDVFAHNIKDISEISSTDSQSHTVTESIDQSLDSDTQIIDSASHQSDNVSELQIETPSANLEEPLHALEEIAKSVQEKGNLPNQGLSAEDFQPESSEDDSRKNS
ncbi:MAG: hypothetical protein OXF49_00090 [Candidatus Saccharibacteria bacterium]|nr:hypothetical protein [Candidatus Saccharibacteria bacterium]